MSATDIGMMSEQIENIRDVAARVAEEFYDNSLVEVNLEPGDMTAYRIVVVSPLKPRSFVDENGMAGSRFARNRWMVALIMADHSHAEFWSPWEPPLIDADVARYWHIENPWTAAVLTEFLNALGEGMPE